MSNVHIPEMVYVKFQERKREGETYLLGFLTPYAQGDDPAFDARKDTVNRWASYSRSQQKSILTQQAWVGYNEPLEGFKILHTVDRYRTSNKVWRLLDPRGFELEISSWNLSDLLQRATLEKGVIKEPCVWGRDSRGENYLLSTNSPEYIEAVSYTKVRNTKISLRDVQLGDTITLRDNTTVEYLGGMYTLEVHGDEVKRYYYCRSTDKEGNPTLVSSSSIKVGALVKSVETPLTPEEACAWVNENRHLLDSRPKFCHPTKFSVSDVVFKPVETAPPTDTSNLARWETKPLLYAESESLSPKGPYLLEWVDYYAREKDSPLHLSLLKTEKLVTGEVDRFYTIESERMTNSWDRHNPYYTREYVYVTHPVTLSDLANYTWKSLRIQFQGEDTPYLALFKRY